MQRWVLLVPCIAIAVAVIAARPVRTPGPLARDFEAYWSAGGTLNDHFDPYARAIWNAERRVGGVDTRRDELLPFVGPPATLLAWSLAARLPYQEAACAWWVILAIALLGLVFAVLYGCGTPVTAFSFLAALALAISFAPISSDLALGQLALPAFLGAALLTVVADRSLALAGISGCVAFAQPNAAIGLLSQIGRNRATPAIAIGAILTYLFGAAARGWSWPWEYAQMLGAHTAAERFSAIQFSPASIAYGLGAAPPLAIMVGIVFAALAIAAAIALAYRVPDRFARFAAFSALAPFVAGFFHEHDLLVSYGAAVWCAQRTTARVRAVALAGTLLTGIDWLGLAQRPSGVAQSLLLAIALGCAFVALGKGVDVRGSAVAGAACTLVFAAAAALAVNHPMPIWPDNLGNFHAARFASAAAVWLSEQRASGLLDVVPAWALLRAPSLLGCALLAGAIYRHSSCCRTA
jgi:hypothetical protein